MNKKISGRYRFLMRIDFRRKYFLRIQAATYFLCFFLLCAMSIWIDNMGKIRQVEAAERYGFWQYGLIGASEEEMALIENNRLLQSTGRAVVYGDLYKEGSYALGSVGTLEESVLRLCGMRLLSGHLPQEENEIVLEQNTLEQLGIPYASEGEITLQIKGAEETSPREMTYILCGVLQSDSTYTEAGSYLPMAVVSKEGAAAIGPYEQQELFMQMVENCDVAAVREDLIAAARRQASGMTSESEWIQNAFVYGEDFKQGDMGRFRLLISVIGYAVIFGLVFTHIFREKKRTDILRTLGMMEREILQLLIGEQLIIWLAAMFSGLVLGGAGTRLLLQNYMRGRNLQTAISYPTASIQAVCIISSLSLLAGVLAGALCSKLKSPYRKMQEMDYRILEKGRLSPLKGNMKNALRRRELQVRWGVYIRFFCLQVLMFSAVAFCVGWLYLHYEGYRFNKNSYICDYIITSSAEDGMGSTVDDNFLNRIRNMDGVEKVETVYWNSQVEILDEEVRNGAYYQAIENYWVNGRSSFASFLRTLEAGDALIDELATQVNEGEWNQEKLEAGEEVIIYLPIRRVSNNGLEGISYLEYLNHKEEYDVLQEEQIEVGNMLSIRINGIEREVKIGGIIYDLYILENQNRQILWGAYDIFCGKGLFEELAGDKVSSSTYVYMGSGERTSLMAQQVENMLNRSHVNWKNIRDRIRPRLEYYKNGLLFGAALLTGFGIFFGFLIISFFNREMEIAAYKNRLIQNLGGDLDKKERIFLHGYRWSMGLGVLAALLCHVRIAVFITKYGGQLERYYYIKLKPGIIYALLLAIQLFLLVGELLLQRRILRKKEKFSKNMYYFAL